MTEVVEEFPDMTNIGEGILNLLECPVCINLMVPPILICKNGHNVCNKCRPKVQKCPTCRDEFSDTRNLFAENVAEKYMVRCRFYAEGCRVKVHNQQRAQHENFCSFSPVECLVGVGIDKVEKCGWRGSRAELLEHLRGGSCPRSIEFTRHPHVEEYSRSVSISPNSLSPNLLWDFHPLAGPWYVGLDFKQSYRSLCLVSILEELFWIHVYNDVKTQKHYEAMTYIGPEEEAVKFVYQHSLRSLDGTQTVTFTNIMHSESEDADALFAAGKCLVLDFSIFKQYFNIAERTLPGYTLTIKKTEKNNLFE